jgi:Fe(3+) dicitrate transport protein
MMKADVSERCRSGGHWEPAIFGVGLFSVALVFALSPISAVAQEGEEDGGSGGAVELPPPDQAESSGSDSESDAPEQKESDDERASADGEGSEEESTSGEAVDVPEVEVIGRSEKDVESVPGSAEVIDEEELESQSPLNANEAMRSVPGVHVQPEEGMGLRQNIGIRGLNPTRSRKVHVMEDGVPIALGPYGEPEMYYTPPVERMSRIEIVKGSGAILYGPQTIGGVINYITPQPPEDFTMKGEARGGSYGYYQGQLSVGGTQGDVGYWLNGMHQRFGGHRDLNLRMTDLTSKFRLDLGETQTLSLKFNVYDEWSRSTYLGLTKAQYENDPSANYAKHDRFKIRRYGAQATHVWTPSADLVLETRLYGHNIQRNWRRQDFDRRPRCDEDPDCDGYQRVIDGQGREVSGDRSRWPNDRSGVFFRDSTGNRNREFTVGGIEPRATVFWSLGEVENELQTGIRFHVEHTDERRINGEHKTSPSGTIRDDDERLGRAVAAYALNRFKLFDERLEISPGLRYESLWTERTTYRTREDGEPTDLEPPAENRKHVDALIPGGGVAYHLTDALTLFGGVHRGFSPPRTKDAITKDGERLALEPEFSWNYEVGARLRKGDWLQAELAGFVLDFKNQIIAPAESGGAVSTDPEARDSLGLAAVQGGETIHRGVEAGGTFDPGKMGDLGFEMPMSVTYTFVDARFQDGWKASIQGNELPYSPNHRLAGRIGYKHPNGFELQVDGDWLSGQYTDKVETVPANRAGVIGWIDSRFILDAKISYTYKPWGATAFVSGKNLLNDQYIASRAPRGIKPGMFRHVFGGVRFEI